MFETVITTFCLGMVAGYILRLWEAGQETRNPRGGHWRDENRGRRG